MFGSWLALIAAGVLLSASGYGYDLLGQESWDSGASESRISVEMMQIGANTLGLGHPLMDSALDSALIGLRREESALSGFRSGIWDSADQLKWSLAEEVSGAFGVDPCSRAFRTTANLTDIAASVLVPPGALLAKGAIRSAALSRAASMGKGALAHAMRQGGQVMKQAQGFGKAVKSGGGVRMVGSTDSAGRRGISSLGNRGGVTIGKGNVGVQVNSGPMRVTQYFNPKRGAFPVDGRFALSSEATLGNRLVDGVTGPTTWVAPHAAGKMSTWRRLMTGVGNRRNYVEFDILPGELVNPAGLKSMLGRYQQVISGKVNLTSRNAVFGTSGFNWLDAGVRYGVPTTGIAGGGYLFYNSNE